MIALLDLILKLTMVVGTIIIICKVIPMLVKSLKSIKDTRAEGKRIAEIKQRRQEEVNRANAEYTKVMDQLVNIKCPGCGVKIPSEDLQPVCYCSYCGHRIIVPENLLKDALKYSNDEENRKIALKKLENEERQNNYKMILLVVLLGLMVALFIWALNRLWS